MKIKHIKLKKPFLIAEIGINHNGSLKLAKQMIDLAKLHGFDAVKFQKRNPDISTPENQKNIHRNTPWGYMTYLKYKKKIEFGLREFKEINKYCKKNKIIWFASAWDIDSIKFLKRFNFKYNKVASAMLTNLPLIKEAWGGSYTDPEELWGPFVEFAGTKISSNWNVNGDRVYKFCGESDTYTYGTGIDPATNERWQGTLNDNGTACFPNWKVYDPSPPDPFHYNQELLTPHKVFGMGDACLHTPVKQVWSANAGQRYQYSIIDVDGGCSDPYNSYTTEETCTEAGYEWSEGLTHPYLKTIKETINTELNKLIICNILSPSSLLINSEFSQEFPAFLAVVVLTLKV